MHLRNRYREGTNFSELAEKFPSLKQYLVFPANSPPTIDFKNEDAQRCLTQALLWCDFGLKLQLPMNRLCPPVPNRLNYVLWIQDIVNASKDLEGAGDDVVYGVDIGTGASAIYPLLACKTERTWSFVVSEIDPLSLRYAQINVSSNGLDARIKILQSSTDSSILLPLSIDPNQIYAFSMCNPPFYSSAEDVARSAEAKQYEPNAARVCTGAEVEMITEGGEVAFVGRMVEESLGLRTQCRWYTSMLGKLSSVSDIVELLRKHGIDNYAITEFVQGQTRRWAVGWSFTDVRLPDSVSRLSNPALQQSMPAHTTVQQPVNAPSMAVLADSLSAILFSINDAQVEKKIKQANGNGVDEQYEMGLYFVVRARQDTWTRNARRRRLREQQDSSIQSPSSTSGDLALIALVCTVHIRETKSARPAVTEGVLMDTEEMGHFVVEFQWKKGMDRTLFETFCSHVSRKVLAKG